MKLASPSSNLRKVSRRIFRITRRILYWSLPPFILYLIFSQIDLDRLVTILSNANIFLVLASITLIVLVVMTGGLRWHYLLHHYDCASLPITTSVSDYWKSLAVGVLVPGSLGSDAYRIMVLGRQTGLYLRSAFVIGVEKIATLFACAVLITGLYPLLVPNNLPDFVAQIVDVLYIFFIVGIALSASIILVRRQNWFRRLATAFNAHLEALARRVAALTPTPRAPETGSGHTLLTLMASAFSPRVALPTVAMSVAIPMVTATQSQLYFQSLGYDIPFSINVFITPLLFLLITLPISFGGIGIREGASILLYGAFGVPAEIALVVSYCGLLSILLSHAIGASLFLMGKQQHNIDDLQAGALTPENLRATTRTSQSEPEQ